MGEDASDHGGPYSQSCWYYLGAEKEVQAWQIKYLLESSNQTFQNALLNASQSLA
jgi:hypothetical protein